MNRPRKKDTHLPQCVYHRNGAYFYVKRGKWTRLGATLKEATAKWASLYEGEPGSMAALIAKALPVICKGKKPNTASQYRHAAKKLSKIFAEFRVEDVQQKHVAGMKLQLESTPNMANRCLSVLRLVFDFAVENQLIASNPAIGVRRHEEQKRKRLLEWGELEAIYAASGDRLRAIIDLALRTGQRIGDVLKIRRADLTPEGIRFEQQKTGTKITVAWTPELREVVERAKKLNQNIRAFTLLHNRRGKPPDYRTVREQWVKACRRAKVSDAHLHDLRAMSATWAKRQGLNATPLLGHASASQTVRYLRDRDSTVVEGPSFGQSKDLLDKAGGNAGK